MNEAVLIARLLLGLVFVFSTLTKLQDPRGFIDGVKRFGLLPNRFSGPAAITLILVEATVALSLLTGIVALIGLAGAIALILLFTGLMIQNARREEPLPCYCFGSGESEANPYRVLIRLMLFLLIGLAVLLNWVVGDSALLTRSPTTATLLLALAAMVLGSWLLRFPELREWHRTPMPAFSNPGNRMSLRHVPLEPVQIQQEGSQ